MIKVCVLLVIAICADVLGVILRKNEKHITDDIEFAFLQETLVYIDDPSVVFIHDFENVLPFKYKTFIQQNFNKYHVLYLSKTSDNYTSNVRGKHWFSWLETPMAKPQFGKMVFIFIFLPQNLDFVISDAARLVRFETTLNYFIFLPRSSNDFTSVLFHEKLENLKYKVVVTTNANNINILDIHTMCFFCDYGNPEITKLGKYTKGINNEAVLQNLFPDFTTNLHGKFLLGSWITNLVPEDVLYMRDNYVPQYPAVVMILDFSRTLNFHWMAVLFEPAEFAEVEMPDGSWTGQTGAVYHRKTDFGVCKVNHQSMLQVIDDIENIIYDYYSFVNRNPKPDYSWKAITQPYTLDMWLSILTACFVFGIAFFGLLRISSLVENPFPHHKRPSNLLAYSMRYIYFTLIEESPELVPKSHSSRVFLSFWWIFSLVIICGYQSKLISFLAQPKLEALPKSYIELADAKSWMWGMSALHAPYYRIVSGNPAPGTLHDRIDRGIIPTPTLFDCIWKAATDDYSCISSYIFLTMAKNLAVDIQGVSPVELQNERTMQVNQACLVEKYSVIRPILQKTILRMWSSGVIEKYLNDYPYGGRLEGLRRARAEHRINYFSMALNSKQIQGAFYGLGICGWLLPILFLIWEKCAKS